MQMCLWVTRDQVCAGGSFGGVHNTPGCLVGGESDNEILGALNVRRGDGSGGWSMIEMTMVSRCIIGA